MPQPSLILDSREPRGDTMNQCEMGVSCQRVVAAVGCEAARGEGREGGKERSR